MTIASKPQSVAEVPKPAQSSVRAWCLADFKLQPDGSVIIRPHVPDEDLDTWVRVKEAAALLGITQSSIYDLVDEGFLLPHRPLKRLILVSLRSVRALYEACDGDDFWNNPSAQTRILAAVEQRKRSRAATAFQNA